MAAVIVCVGGRGRGYGYGYGYGYGCGIIGGVVAVVGVGVFVAGMDAVEGVEGVEVGQED